ncbi:hypothetical protein B6A10_05675 [Flavobacterium sp. L1I52]|uniref:Endonuclease NucS C-terminal domain-containing protein n=1 Tax=Flavobacterium pokkalii TaxID=1940408 RepID=A0ABR7UPY0_9FLAO|nr:endonuclease NucS domain-containing protein [Flavobacterium pokkalii]MBD0724662.1 hypothetical protein [Flavobacterium pokkalii]
MSEKNNFIDWMTNKWSENTVKSYSGKIDNLSKKLKAKSMIPTDTLYKIKNPNDLEVIYKHWYDIPEFRERDLKNRRQDSNAFKRYIEFRLYEEKLGLNEDDKSIFGVSQTNDLIDNTESYLFALEEHLQDFLIRNLSTIKKHNLKLYDDGERRGKEFPTSVGPIDILTIDDNNDFYVFETKLSRGMDKALGQLLRYMGWVKINLAKEKNVYGIIVANKMDEKIKYAVEVTPNVSLCEYEMKFDIAFLDKR